MRRRVLLATASGAVLLSAIRTVAQPRLRLVGALDSGESGPFLPEIRKTLARLGYVEGTHLRFESRSSQSPEILSRLAEELVALKPDVIVARLTPALRAAMTATRTIPIVMTACGGPVESGLIDSLARPGGNVTGMSLGGMNLIGKRLELIREVAPAVEHIAMVGAGADPFSRILMDGTVLKGRELGMRVTPIGIAKIQELDARFAAMGNDRPQAMLALANVPAEPLIALAFRNRLPLFPTQRSGVEAGGLLSYGGLLQEQYRGAAIYVDRILRGAAPATLPVEEPRHFELVVNLKTARTLGLAIPPIILVRATEVIE